MRALSVCLFYRHVTKLLYVFLCLTFSCNVKPAFIIPFQVCPMLCMVYNYTCCCNAIVFQMENTEKSTEQATSTTFIELENILKGLDSLSNCMDQLACMYHPNPLPLHLQNVSKRH